MTTAGLRNGFTLVEIAMAIAILVIGLAASASVFALGLRWSGEARHQYTAMAVARDALAGLTPTSDRSAEPTMDPEMGDADGWLNGYYVQRRVLTQEDLPGQPVERLGWEVSVYAGGDDTSGELIFRVETEGLIWKP